MGRTHKRHRSSESSREHSSRDDLHERVVALCMREQFAEALNLVQPANSGPQNAFWDDVRRALAAYISPVGYEPTFVDPSLFPGNWGAVVASLGNIYSDPHESRRRRLLACASVFGASTDMQAYSVMGGDREAILASGVNTMPEVLDMLTELDAMH